VRVIFPSSRPGRPARRRQQGYGGATVRRAYNIRNEILARNGRPTRAREALVISTPCRLRAGGDWTFVLGAGWHGVDAALSGFRPTCWKAISTFNRKQTSLSAQG